MHESVTTKQLRSRLGGYLRQVEDGQTLLVVRQGQPVAELRPYSANGQAMSEAGQPGRAEPEAPAGPVPAAAGTVGLGLAGYQCHLEGPGEASGPEAEEEPA